MRLLLSTFAILFPGLMVSQTHLCFTDPVGAPTPWIQVLTLPSESYSSSDENGCIDLPVTTSDRIFVPFGLSFQTDTLTLPESYLGDTLIHQLQWAAHHMNPIVVSGDRTFRRKSDLAVQVHVINEETLENVNAFSLIDGLSFQGGVRVESNCQTCNFTQVRMNGLGGGYTQILLDSRPIFSSLMGLYGLEQIPTSMIDRIETVRGGGSALYGSSAIAGTINIITKRPEGNELGVSLQNGWVDGSTNDLMLNAHGSLTSSDQKSGLLLMMSHRIRQEWDANGDGFSEIPRINNLSAGLRGFYDINKKSALEYGISMVTEERAGGDQLDQPAHQRIQSEDRDGKIHIGHISHRQEWSKKVSMTNYFAGQWTDRTHYTGIDGADGYGQTQNYSWQWGQQWNTAVDWGAWGSGTWVSGIEYQEESVYDEIESYDYLIDQQTQQLGLFSQGDLTFNRHIQVNMGLRAQYHNFVTGVTWLPRLALKYNFNSDWNLRLGYGRGFRAPQAFDSDLHIAFAGGGVSTIRIDQELKPEFSDSYTLSLEHTEGTSNMVYGFSVNGFYTRLTDAFFIKDDGTDADGNTLLFKTNAQGSQVYGLSLEGRLVYQDWLEFDASITGQRSLFDEPVSWSENVSGTQRYLRTPDLYGYFSSKVILNHHWAWNTSGIYTGPMLIPHFGGAPGVPEDLNRTSPHFWEIHSFLEYSLRVSDSSNSLTFSAGVQNIFNAFQNDFDIGKNRDSNYAYGPIRPRTYLIKMTYSSK